MAGLYELLNESQLRGKVTPKEGAGGRSRNIENRTLPEWHKATFLPYEANNWTGELRWAVPQALDSLASALAAPGRALGNQYPLMIDPASGVNYYDGMAEDAAGLAGLLTLGSGALPAEAGALNMGLRSRYASALRAAAPGKDIEKIKLTPARMEVAKDYMQKGPKFQDYFLRTFGVPYDAPFPKAVHLDEAELFARAAAKAGHKVKVKYPDGGSAYVRVGDEGTVRFADHAQPTELVGSNYVKVGGYSKDLGRRHYPAELSVDQSGGSSLADALRWLGEKSK